jgi:hypothetical protein
MTCGEFPAHAEQGIFLEAAGNLSRPRRELIGWCRELPILTSLAAGVAADPA